MLRGAYIVGLLLAANTAADAVTNPTKVVPLRAEPFNLTQVRLLAGPFKDAMERDRKYLLALDADRLLHNFRVTAGLPSTARPLGGWEDPKGELRGHTMGHYLSACALMYASTGDAKIKAKTDTIVAELAKCQAAMPKAGYNTGFLSAYPESFFDRVDKAQPVWAPYYTLHKIMAGLLDVYQYCDDKPALDVLEKMAGWLKLRVDRLSHEQMQKALGNEHGGMNEVLANLYGVTGNLDYLKLAQAFNHEAVFDPLARGEDRLDGLHANTQIPKMIGAAREYELTGETRYKDVASFFWDRVALHRSYVIGGDSDHEHFFPVDQFGRHLGTDTAETCNTYNMLKLTRHLFEWQPSATAMDFYERGLYNQILASQDPEQGMFVYLMSLKPGHFKTYSTPEDSFWCCVGTGMENHSKYGDTIYFHDADSLYLNLFIASQLTWPEKGLTVRQDTRFPEQDTTRLTLQCAKPTELALKVRYPSWAHDMTLAVNGKAVKLTATPGSYVSLRRKWRSGDRVDIRLPMTLHSEQLPDTPNTLALLYGPIVLAGELGTENMPSPYARGQTDLNRVPSPTVPVFVGDQAAVLAKVRAVAGKPLTFGTQGLARPHEVTLIPFYRTHHERYSVYWQVLPDEAWQKQQAEFDAAEGQRKALEGRIVDEVRPGEPQPETDHALKSESSNSGEFNGRKWRDAGNGGWFSYEVKVQPDTPQVLQYEYWGSDIGNREFDILVDGTKVGTEVLNNNKPEEFFTAEYALPAELVKGKEKITVRFAAHPGKMAGGVFGVKVLAAK